MSFKDEFLKTLVGCSGNNRQLTSNSARKNNCTARSSNNRWPDVFLLDMHRVGCVCYKNVSFIRLKINENSFLGKLANNFIDVSLSFPSLLPPPFFLFKTAKRLGLGHK